jgi:hypothetical protein
MPRRSPPPGVHRHLHVPFKLVLGQNQRAGKTRFVLADECRPQGAENSRSEAYRSIYSNAGWRAAEAVSEMAGNANVSITMDRYEHLFPSQVEKLAEAMWKRGPQGEVMRPEK